MVSRSLKYSLSMDRDDFEAAERLVKAVLLTSRKRPKLFNRLVLATEDVTQLSAQDQQYIAEWDSEGQGNLEGLCCWKGGDYHAFNIWLSPTMNPMSDLYRVSLLHELVHGYMDYAPHDAKFRDLLGRVFYHYCDIVSPLEGVGIQVSALNYRYMKRKKDESESDFIRRAVLAKEATQTKAEEEYSAVAEMYERIS